MADAERIYLDNAATSWPKPPAVYEACDHYLRHVGAAAGRSAYREASEVAREVDLCRMAIAQLIGASDGQRIVFTHNGTDSLNLAIHGALRPGDHVVATDSEHNSVLRPLATLARAGMIEVTYVPCDADGFVSPKDIAAALRENTRLVAVCHASNVTGAVQPIEEIGKLLASHPTLFLVDAAQSLGHVAIDVQEMGVDLLAAPGHKGLLGPLGTGLLYIRPGVEEQLQPTRQGGTGSVSESDRQPDELPDKYESGNLNVVGVLGLKAGVEYVRERGLDAIYLHERELTAQLIEGLVLLPGVLLRGPWYDDQRVGVVSVTVDGYEPQEFALLLDSARRIQVRAGLHCAPRMHASQNTLAVGGAVRFSIGPFNTPADIDAVLETMRQLV